MEPVTHALASLALARAGFGRATPRSTSMLLVSGLAADIDWLSYGGGASTFLAWHRTASHSIVGAVLIAAITAIAFSRLWRHSQTDSISFAPAFGISCIGAASHLLLDLADGYGIKLLWPFSQRWYAGNFAPSLDPWLIALLLAALLLPILFRMVNAEIGSRPKRKRADFGMIVIWGIALLYLGARTVLHQEADSLLLFRRYHNATPIQASAFATSSPLNWHGVIETDNTVDEIDVSLAGGAHFDPDKARVQFKPTESPMLDRARQTEAARTFLSFARFPLATIEPSQEGRVIRIRDLRFTQGLPGEPEIEAVVNVNAQSEVKSAKLEFSSATRTGVP